MSNTEKKTVSYLGVPGSYSHQACMECFPDHYHRGFKKFDEVIRAADAGEVDFAILPVENSSAGRVTEVYNLLPSVKLQIIGEYLLPIHHCLMVAYNAYRKWVPRGIDEKDILDWKDSPLTEEEKQEALASIKEVHSHSQALMQCSNYLESKLPNAQTVVDFDTATAAQNLSNYDEKDRAVISSAMTADIYSLLLLDKDIENDPYNMTRFLIFGREAVEQTSPDEHYITSILFQTNHIPGALIGALKAFSDNNVNLTKLETYMVSQELPNPTFYVDIGTSMANPDLQNALKEFEKHAAEYHILGSYPASAERGNKNSFLPVK